MLQFSFSWFFILLSWGLKPEAGLGGHVDMAAWLCLQGEDRVSRADGGRWWVLGQLACALPLSPENSENNELLLPRTIIYCIFSTDL